MKNKEKAITQEEWKNLKLEEVNEIFEAITSPIERLELLQTIPQFYDTENPYRYWIKSSKAELIQWYMNAYRTRSCGGHHKGKMNDNYVTEYLKYMKKYEVPVPPNEITYIMGQFNGKGSY